MPSIRLEGQNTSTVSETAMSFLGPDIDLNIPGSSAPLNAHSNDPSLNVLPTQ